MKTPEEFRVVLGKGERGDARPLKADRRAAAVAPAGVTLAPNAIAKALKTTAGAKELIAQIPELGNWQLWLPVASFTVCQKTGTATYLDIWDADHFDGFTDMQHNLADCRVWFSGDGYTTWGSGQTKSGRINCYFRAPSDGNYVCNVQLQSFGGAAMVECLIDAFSYGPLPFNGSINQPHPAALTAGYHHFRIRQMSGSFFFVSLTVWKV